MPFSIRASYKHWKKDFTHNHSFMSLGERMRAAAARTYEDHDADEAKQIKDQAEAKFQSELDAAVKEFRKKAIIKHGAQDDTGRPSPSSQPIKPPVVSVPMLALPAAVGTPRNSPAAVAPAPQPPMPSPRNVGVRRTSTLKDLHTFAAADNKTVAAVDLSLAPDRKTPQPNSSPKSQPNSEFKMSSIPQDRLFARSYDSPEATDNRKVNIFHATAMALSAGKQFLYWLVDGAAEKLKKWWKGKDYRPPIKADSSNYFTRGIKFLIALAFALPDMGAFLLSQSLGRGADKGIDKYSAKKTHTIFVDMNKPEIIGHSNNFKDAVKPKNVKDLAGGKKLAPSASASRAAISRLVHVQAATPKSAKPADVKQPTETSTISTRTPGLTIRIETARRKEENAPGAETPVAATTLSETPDSAALVPAVNATRSAVGSLLSSAAAGTPRQHSSHSAVVGHAAPPSPSPSFANLATTPKPSVVQLAPLPTTTGPASKFAAPPGDTTPNPAASSRPQSADPARQPAVFKFFTRHS